MFLGATKPLKKLPEGLVKIQDVDDIKVGDKIWVFYGGDDFLVKNHNCVIKILAIVEGQILYKHWGTRYAEWVYGVKPKNSMRQQVIKEGAGWRRPRKRGRKYGQRRVPLESLDDVAEVHR